MNLHWGLRNRHGLHCLHQRGASGVCAITQKSCLGKKCVRIPPTSLHLWYTKHYAILKYFTAREEQRQFKNCAELSEIAAIWSARYKP
jgi:hypothetical protein